MTVREMIEALRALDAPDALVVRPGGGYSPHVFFERGSSWDIVMVRQSKSSIVSNQWFLNRSDGEQADDRVSLAVVI